MANTHSPETIRKVPHLLIMPFPAQGHMLPLLDLTHHLLALGAGFAITVLTTPKNLPYLSPLLATFPCVQPLVLPFPTHPLIPYGVENCKDLPPSVPSFPLFIHALGSLHSPLLAWARSITAPPDAIISDFFLGWTNGLAKELGIPRITFSPSGTITLAINHHTWTNMPKNPNLNPNPSDHESTTTTTTTVSYSTLPGSPCIPWYQLSSLYRGYVEGDPMSEFIKEGLVANMESWGIVFNSFRELEEAYLDHLKGEFGHERVWAVGPVSLLGNSAAASERGGPSSVSEAELMSWLDGCQSSSVVYVCFGSQVVLRQEQASAVATALEESGVHFVWSMKEGPTTAVPDGFEERTRGTGLTIKGWIPQVLVLSHHSVGSFLTHCGWNSVLEAVTTGVTMLMWPMEADQFYNANLLEGARIGRRVCEGRDGVPRIDLLNRALSDSVRRSGEERLMTKKLSKKALEAVKKDGSSWRDMDVFVESLKKLCCVNNGSRA